MKAAGTCSMACYEQEWVGWPQIRAHLCTLAVAVGLPASWRAPRKAFEFGGLQYGLTVTFTLVIVALPLVLLQLAIGQLSQQDAVGVWRAVPFFRGVGYLKILVSFISSVYTSIYLALTVTYLLTTVSSSVPFTDCSEPLVENHLKIGAGLACLNETFMAPVIQKPEYFLAEGLIVAVIWIVLPFIFYHPVKYMKRLFYLLGPIIIVIAIVIVSCIEKKANLSSFVDTAGWKSFKDPYIWHDAIIQALISSQIAGGYLISAADTVYSSTDVQWSAVIIIITNVITTWFGLLFWYGISSFDKDTTVFAVLNQAYQVSEGIEIVWPVLIFLTLVISGFITLLSLAFPMFDRVRRLGIKWRRVYLLGYFVAVGITLAVLSGRLLTLSLLEDVAVPFIISATTVLELLPFLFIYGWKMLVDDIQFLTGGNIAKCWIVGWYLAPGVILSFTVWWLVVMPQGWGSWVTETVVASATVVFLIVVVLAVVVVARQVQYDFLWKLNAAFKPSRHWGPRDPISHYYWLARRNEAEGNTVFYHRRQLGQFSGRPSILILTNKPENDDDIVEKRRSNSDDWLFRKHNLIRSQNIINTRKRAISLDMSPRMKVLQKKIVDSSYTSVN